MHQIKHIAITAEDPFETAELFKRAFGLEELSRGDSELAREVYLTDGHINLAIVCWKRTRENPNPYPEGYGLDHFGFQVEDLAAAEARAGAVGATPQPPPEGGSGEARRAHLLRAKADPSRREVRPERGGVADVTDRDASAGVLSGYRSGRPTVQF